MQDILNAVNSYKDLAIRCALENSENKNLITIQIKEKAYALIIEQIKKHELNIEINALKNSLKIIDNKSANDA